MKNLLIGLPVLVLITYAGLLKAESEAYNLGGLMEGSVDIQNEVAADCPPLMTCNRIRKTLIRRNNPAGGAAFPEVCKTPAPPAPPIPIPYPNIAQIGERVEFLVNDFISPSGDSATAKVGITAESDEVVVFDVVVESLSGFELSSILFGGEDAEGDPVEYTLILNSASADSLVITGGLAVLAGF